MNDRQLHLLVSPGFLGCLFLLLLNDFVLKQQLHNALTGKLSDIAGLFIFPLFLTALVPRLRSYFYIAVGISFIFWKSAYSQPIIETWNSFSLFSISRTVDYSDLWALLVLPSSFAYCRIPSRGIPRRAPVYLVAVISIFAFTATQFSKKTAYNNEYQFDVSRSDLIQRMSHLPARSVGVNFGDYDTFEVAFDDCIAYATITLNERENRAIIVLKQIEYRCPSGLDETRMRQFVEKEFINELQVPRVTRSAVVLYISPGPPTNRQQLSPEPGSSTPVKPASKR